MWPHAMVSVDAQASYSALHCRLHNEVSKLYLYVLYCDIHKLGSNRLLTMSCAFLRVHQQCLTHQTHHADLKSMPMSPQNSNLSEGTLNKCLMSVSSTLRDLLIYSTGPQSGFMIGKIALQWLALQEGLDHDPLAWLLSSKALCIEKIAPVRRVRVLFLKAFVLGMGEV